jgi:hypothetical protein
VVKIKTEIARLNKNLAFVKAQDIVLSPGVNTTNDNFDPGEVTPKHKVERAVIKTVTSPRA